MKSVAGQADEADRETGALAVGDTGGDGEGGSAMASVDLEAKKAEENDAEEAEEKDHARKAPG